MSIKTIEDIDLKGKRVIVRCDFNVPLDESGNITDEKRIVSSLPTIKFILARGASVVLMSHLGRPKGKRVPEMSLAPVARSLSAHLGVDVTLAPDCIGQEVGKLVSAMKPGDVVLLENLRFHAGETGNDPEFSKQLAELADVYVNDAFGTAHRAHASTEGITHYMDDVASGYLLKKEIDYLDSALKNPGRPFVAIIGGVKISGKIDVITSLLDKADTLLVGGGMAYTFFKAMGIEIGKSVLEADKVDLAGEILAKSGESPCEMLLPVDTMIADSFSNDAATKFVGRDGIPADWEGLDIGMKTRERYAAKIMGAKTVVWNGPMGVFEMDKFAGGTKAVADAMVEATRSGAKTIVGGGDSAAAIAKFGLENEMSHISTGGGASLELLEGKVLPGVAALDRP
ncbi:MAG: phosphoglycerate kinase [Candidatus Latescibacteria bacterium]|nr:phosphoglycerate kinase [Candidatus Latescibacterota bacterium]